MARRARPHRRASPLRFSLDAARQEIIAVAREHGATRVRVFGSFARGTASENSDVDLLVDMEAGRTLLDLIALSRALRARLGRRVDVVTERSLSPHLRKRVLAEARRV